MHHVIEAVVADKRGSWAIRVSSIHGVMNRTTTTAPLVLYFPERLSWYMKFEVISSICSMPRQN